MLDNSGLTSQLMNMNSNPTMFSQGQSPTYNMTSIGGDASKAGATGKQQYKIPSSGGDTSNHWNPSAESRFMPNQWADIGGGDQNGLQNTGMAGSSMNLYIQKMLSNPAIMQLLQQRMSQGVSNGS